MASNGWWLGNNGKDYPLFIANGGFGTGRFASLTDTDEPFNFTCTPVESNRTVGKVDENLCWGPIGSVSLVFDEWWAPLWNTPSVVPPWGSPPTSPVAFLYVSPQAFILPKMTKL